VLGNERQAARGKSLGEQEDVGFGHLRDVDLHEGCERQQGVVRVGPEIIEHEPESRRAQTAARLEDVTVNDDVLAELEDGDVGAQQRGGAVEQQRPRQIDERGSAIGNGVEPKVEHGVGQQTRTAKSPSVAPEVSCGPSR